MCRKSYLKGKVKLKLMIIGFGILFVFMSSCDRQNEWKNIPLEVKFERFDQEILQFNADSADYYIQYFNSKYGRFFEIYNQSILRIGSSNSRAYSDYLLAVTNDYFSHLLFKEIALKFPDLTPIESELTTAFKKWNYLFPERIVPELVSFMGNLNQSVVITDSILAVSLDKYLGSDCELYTSSGFYNYQIANMKPEKIASDCVKAWCMTEWEMDEEANLFDQMIYQGKILFLVKYFLADVSDETLMGFNSDQLKWVKNNEEQMWDLLIEEKLLFTTDYKIIKKLTSDGPFTSLFTQESPARAVNWLGYQIISKFMGRNSDISIPELMEITDSQNILKRSKYKPKH